MTAWCMSTIGPGLPPSAHKNRAGFRERQISPGGNSWGFLWVFFMRGAAHRAASGEVGGDPCAQGVQLEGLGENVELVFVGRIGGQGAVGIAGDGEQF